MRKIYWDCCGRRKRLGTIVQRHKAKISVPRPTQLTRNPPTSNPPRKKRRIPVHLLIKKKATRRWLTSFPAQTHDKLSKLTVRQRLRSKHHAFIPHDCLVGHPVLSWLPSPEATAEPWRRGYGKGANAGGTTKSQDLTMVPSYCTFVVLWHLLVILETFWRLVGDRLRKNARWVDPGAIGKPVELSVFILFKQCTSSRVAVGAGSKP